MTDDKDLAGDSEWLPDHHPGHEFGPGAVKSEAAGHKQHHRYLEILRNLVSDEEIEEVLNFVVQLRYALEGQEPSQDISSELSALPFKKEIRQSISNGMYKHVVHKWIFHEKEIGESVLDFGLLRSVVDDRLKRQYRRLFSDDEFVPDGL